MKKPNYTFFRSVFFIGLSFGSDAMAQTQPAPLVSLSAPEYAGTGCPIATLSSALSPNATALSLLFDNFVVETDATSPQARKSCSMAIPMQIPNGYRVSIIGIDYRGFNNLPDGATAELLFEYVFAGGATTPFNMTFRGPLTENYFLQNTLSTQNQIWSSCGGDTVLRKNNQIILTTNAAGEQATSTIDSIDVTASDVNRSTGMTLFFHWQNCAPNTTTNQTTQPSGASSMRPNLATLMGLTAVLSFFFVS